MPQGKSWFDSSEVMNEQTLEAGEVLFAMPQKLTDWGGCACYTRLQTLGRDLLAMA